MAASKTDVELIEMNIKQYFLPILMICFLQSHVFSQSDSTKYYPEVISSDWNERGLSIGFDFSKFLFAEIGHYRSYVWEAGGFPTLSMLMNYGCELSYIDNVIIAPKIQGRIHAYFFNASLTALYYTDIFDKYALKLRPEIGLGLWNFDVNYGYNIGIAKNEFEKVNKHVICLRYYLNLKKKYLNEYDRDGNKVER